MAATSMTGRLKIKKTRIFDDRLYRFRNHLRPGFWLGWFQVRLAKFVSKLFGVVTITSELRGTLTRRGTTFDLGVLGYRKVTDNGVAFIVDCWQNTLELENMKYHGCGTGTNAEGQTDTALQTESTTILNPDNTRATGVQSEPSQNILQSLAAVVFDGAGSIAEHGLFSQAATGGGVLFDRTVFTAIVVASGDQISFQYQLTLTAGG